MTEFDPSVFRYQRVEKHIKRMIETGSVAIGEKLPSLRALSVTMGVSLSTVNQAYLELERKGLIESRPRSGFFVRMASPKLPRPTTVKGPAFPPKAVDRSSLIQNVLHTVVGGKLDVSLGLIEPSADLLPNKAMSRVMSRVVKEDPFNSLMYEPVAGNEELRRQIAIHAMEAGLPYGPDDIIITTGAMEALYVALRALTRPGDNVLVQSPTYYCFLQLLESLDLNVIELPSSPEYGISPTDLASALTRFDIKACILTANFNNPDGSLLPSGVRREIVDILTRHDVPLVEDDVSVDLHFGPKRPNSLKHHERDGKILHCCSFSKTIAPGYRVGWVAPGIYYDKCLEVKTLTNVSSASPTQRAVAEYLKLGSYPRHLKRLRNAIHNQMETMYLHIGRHFPEGTRVTHPTGGCVLWVELPGDIDGVEYFYHACEAGIGIVPGPVFTASNGFSNFIRLSCGTIWSEKVENALTTLGDLARKLAR